MKMKRKALVVVLLCAMGLAALSISEAQAAPPWYVASMSLCGANSWGYIVILTDTAATPAFTNQPFVIDPNAANGKVMYAAALTALSNGENVQVLINNPTTAYSTVDALFAIK